MTEDKAFQTADKIYWDLLDTLGGDLFNKCVVNDPETDGTKNTELGSELFETILSTLSDDEDIELTYNEEHKESEDNNE
jgi:hypothetical protein